MSFTDVDDRGDNRFTFVLIYSTKHKQSSKWAMTKPQQSVRRLSLSPPHSLVHFRQLLRLCTGSFSAVPLACPGANRRNQNITIVEPSDGMALTGRLGRVFCFSFMCSLFAIFGEAEFRFYGVPWISGLTFGLAAKDSISNFIA